MNFFKKKKTLFLDRDGVINVDKAYVYKIEDFEFFPDTLSALKAISDKGYQLIIITNQSGIARGYYTVADYKKLTKYYLKVFKEYGIRGVKVLYCPHNTEGKVAKYVKKCTCRKPETGLFDKAIKRYGVDLDLSYAVGDKERDLCVCKKYPTVKGYLFKSEKSGYNTVNSLSELAEIMD